MPIGLNIVVMATAALVVSLVVSFVALAISAYNAYTARGERLQARKADLHVGSSTVWLEGNDYIVELRVTNVGKANAPYLMARLVSPEGQYVSAPVRATEGLPADKDMRLTLRLARASVPPQTPVVRPLLTWDDRSGYDHLKVSGHRVRLDQARELPDGGAA